MGQYDDMIAFANSLPDDIHPEPEQPKSYPPLEDEKLGIYDGPLKASGMVWDPSGGEFIRRAAGLRPPIDPTRIPERGLIHEDPAMDVATTMAGAGVGRVGGKLISKASPIIAKLAEPAIASGTTTALQGGDRKQVLKSAGIGSLFGILPAAITAAKGAPAAVSERLPTAITAGTRTKAAKKVVGSSILDDVLDSNPDLKKTLATSSDPAEKLGATASTLNKLKTANDAVYDAIQKQHGGVPLQAVKDKLDALWESARAESDTATMDAAEAYKRDLDRLADAREGGSVVTAKQIRNVRNTLAGKLQTAPPGTPAAMSQEATAGKIHGAVNEAIEDAAGKTDGVDVDALKDRNRQIATLMNVERSLKEQGANASLTKYKDPSAKAIAKLAHPAHAIAGLVDSAPAAIDARLAMSHPIQDLAHGISPEPSALLAPNSQSMTLRQRFAAGATRTGIAGTASGLARPPSKKQVSDREYTTRILQLMDGGKTMAEAIKQAEAEQ